MIRTTALLLAGLMLLCAGCASAPRPNANQPVPLVAGASGGFARPDNAGGDRPDSTQAEYRIGPHDLLQISVFGSEELSRSVRVSSRGQISLPLVGAIDVGGKTVEQVERGIAAALSKDLMQDPQVSVFVQEYTSQRVTVEGAVNKPGIFPLTGPTTLLQAVAMAEGMGQLADETAVIVFRVIDGKKMAALFDVTQIRHGKQEDPTIVGDDIIVVDRSDGRSLIKTVTDTLRGFIGFRTY